MQNWFKLNQITSYLGKSKAHNHEIFRAKKWRESFEKILKRPVYNENYDMIGKIHDIFGPETSPFISIKKTSTLKFNPEMKLYVKLK